MCVVVLSLRARSRWPIILIGNRDEFHDRASARLAPWDDGSGIVGGRDMQAGGTWLGVNPAAARIAVITNVRDAAGPDPDKRSRGALVTAALTGSTVAPPDAYNGYTLLALDGMTATLSTNRPAAAARPLASGVHAFANLPLGLPCPRAARLAAKLCEFADDALDDDSALFALLRGGHDVPFTLGGDAPDQPFLTHAAYGTRCSTIVRVDADGRGRIAERRYDKGGTPMGDTALTFDYG